MLFLNRTLLLPFALIDLLTPLLVIWGLTVLFLPSLNEPFVAYGSIAGIAGLTILIKVHLQKGYQRFTQMTLTQKLSVTFNSWFISAMLALLIIFLVQDTYDISRSLFVAWALVTPFIILGLKLTAIHTLKAIKRPKTRILFLGRHYQFNKHERHYLRKHRVYIRFTNEADLAQNIEDFAPEFIVLNLKNQVPSALVQYLTRLEINGMNFLSINDFMENFLRKCFIPADHTNLNYLNDIRPFSRAQNTWKKIIDLGGSLALLLLTWPVFLVAIIKIQSQSPGSVFFRQERTGCGGRPFLVVKFRTMHPHDSVSHYTRPDDDRIFPFGMFMRKTRLDELPQLWNILKGDMHLIGPRAEWTLLVKDYEKNIAYYHERHLIKPGISGWAQVMYPYGQNSEDARQKLMYDLYYIKNWSLWLEIETAVKTLRIIFAQKGM
ncbi:exopolysaccharide biosynthesis polyprenyl glycosylphosphotransferase [Thiomicrospira sp. WB1]|uniref:exopolysaccharide biosynthesis polyprenyl glycosylphosphotransferase n=1 Tax=Thiomicrospira sp. WB1 TaxID=1685380 RepID=UPI000746C4E8|nr:exopolysaccharide biosynthesis polyprenyl glycosylphosphotransferase [Thiomicrospira sp. WB1]KUJ72478.1 hypothetical protein AVO41_01305 [Thiomicrospira sp. WB1]